MALVTTDADERRTTLDEGETMLSEQIVGHCHLWFHRYAMEAALNAGDHDAAEHYANRLEDCTKAEPLPWSDLFIARCRALTAHGRNPGDENNRDRLTALRTEIERVKMGTALPAIKRALGV